MESLRGKLLIASPALPDWFRRTVILVVEHAEEGAFGLVLNRPSETTVGEAVPVLADVAGSDERVHIDGELEAESWIVTEPDPGDPFSDGDLWAEALRRQGGELALLARMPVDPSMN